MIDSRLALGCVNARSLGNKAAFLCRIITDEHLDILAISETWHEVLRVDGAEVRHSAGLQLYRRRAPDTFRRAP